MHRAALLLTVLALASVPLLVPAASAGPGGPLAGMSVAGACAERLGSVAPAPVDSCGALPGDAGASVDGACAAAKDAAGRACDQASAAEGAAFKACVGTSPVAGTPLGESCGVLGNGGAQKMKTGTVKFFNDAKGRAVDASDEASLQAEATVLDAVRSAAAGASVAGGLVPGGSILSQALPAASDAAQSAIGSGVASAEKARHDTVKNSIGNIRA